MPIQRTLAQAFPSYQNLELGRVLIIAGEIYEGLGNSTKSQEAFSEALSIAQKYPNNQIAHAIMVVTKVKMKK